MDQLQDSDQLCLLRGCILDVLCLRAALRYNDKMQGFPLHGHRLLTRNDIICRPELHRLIPLLTYAMHVQEMAMDDTEAALLAAILSLQVLIVIKLICSHVIYAYGEEIPIFPSLSVLREK